MNADDGIFDTEMFDIIAWVHEEMWFMLRRDLEINRSRKSDGVNFGQGESMAKNSDDYPAPHCVGLIVVKGNEYSQVAVDIDDLEGDDTEQLAGILRQLYGNLKEHVQMTYGEGYEPSRWWRVMGPDGKLWCETSSEQEARENIRPGDTLQLLYEKKSSEWRIEDVG